MAYTNSPLVDYTKLSPCNSGRRTHRIDRITPHCVVGQASVEGLGSLFQSYSRQTASNYGIGADGRVGLYVNESDRSWCSSSNANDQRAITIECASDTVHPYTMKTVVYNKLIKLCVDICRRNGIKKLLWLGTKEKTLAYDPGEGEAVLSAHRWFANKSCPGDWLYSRFGDLAAAVTKELSGDDHHEEQKRTIYRVQVGAFGSKENAYNYAENVRKKGFSAIVVYDNAIHMYRVQVGAFAVKANAEAEQALLRNAGFDTIIKEVCI